MDFPGNLNAAVARFVDNEPDLRGGSQALTAAYKAGKNSNHISLGAYMATRVPATFAANQRVIAELHALRVQVSRKALRTAGKAQLDHRDDGRTSRGG